LRGGRRGSVAASSTTATAVKVLSTIQGVIRMTFTEIIATGASNAGEECGDED
jgi:hypothetical protein